MVYNVRYLVGQNILKDFSTVVLMLGQIKISTAPQYPIILPIQTGTRIRYLWLRWNNGKALLDHDHANASFLVFNSQDLTGNSYNNLSNNGTIPNQYLVCQKNSNSICSNSLVMEGKISRK